MSGSEILDALAGVLQEPVLHRGSEEYEKENGSYFSAFESEIKPSYIVKPTNVTQVQNVIKVLRPHLLAGQCQMAVRGTGHTPFAGSANVQDGVTVDTRGLKGVALNDDKSIVEIAAGETWASVYAELEKHGLTVAGGRVGRIGVAGLLLGGKLKAQRAPLHVKEWHEWDVRLIKLQVDCLCSQVGPVLPATRCWNSRWSWAPARWSTPTLTVTRTSGLPSEVV